MPTAPRKRDKLLWSSKSKKEYGRTIVALERRDQPGRVRLKIWDGEVRKYRWIPLHGVSIRHMDGRIDIDAEVGIGTILAEMAGAIAKGATVRELCEEAPIFSHRDTKSASADQTQIVPKASVKPDADGSRNLEKTLELLPTLAATPVTQEESAGAKIACDCCTVVTTLGDAADSYFTLVTGKFATATKTRSDQIGFMRDVFREKPPTTLLTIIRRDIYEQIWRAFALRVADGETRVVYPGKHRSFNPANEGKMLKPIPIGNTIQFGGPTHCEKAIRFLAGFFGWLFEKELISKDLSQRPNWVEKMKKDWEQITKRAPESSKRDVDILRFSEKQLRDFMKALEEADRRLKLLVELGMEVRLGQVRCTMRSGLNLDIAPYGLLKTFGFGKKKGTESLLTREQRTLIDYERKYGYLKQYEALYEQRILTDYPLFYGGSLNAEPNPLRRIKPITESGLRRLFNMIEKAAGISHLRGRGWYGIRRAASDLSKSVAKTLPDSSDLADRPLSERDEKALNALTGHSRSSSRQRYEAKEVEAVRRRATEIRRETRRRLGPASLAAKPPEES
jgi:hypothetical protein